ncbi:MAG: RnfABCDGE type electron transport complex subunit D [Lachnospiraceae bacterium]|nr:RnfABCDGE type electron transport complex subunit D [Butyrivibrio sp.]MBQ6904223.1 RnfABCDGE type electron transport complex subunit D [Lachnospiraceae bacterium]
MDENMRHVSSNPHVRAKSTTQSIMMTVVIALLPAAGFGVYNFGVNALVVLCISVATCVLAEFLFEKLLKRPVTVGDLSAVVTGLLLGMNLPPTAPWWLPVVGGCFAIIIVKMLFGGLGQNFMNPALGARCFLLISFPVLMSNFITDTYTSATPLSAIKSAQQSGNVLLGLRSVNVMDMITGHVNGVIGETSMIAIVAGACILILAGVIDLWIPASYICSFVVFLLIFGPSRTPVYISAQLAGGGLMLGAFFMATDYVSCPITNIGKLIYGIFIGIMTGIFRVLGSSAEGVSYAIILGNLLVPLIERFTVPRAFGIPKEPKVKKEVEQS